MEWVTGAAILADLGITAPDEQEQSWADLAAGAVSAGMDARLVGATVTGDEPELLAAGMMAGRETYKRREAVFGITGYVDLQGAAIRIARDYLDAIEPILGRYATHGLA